MNHRTLALAAALLLAPAAAHAQASASPFRFGLAAGASIPTGDAGDVLSTGYHVSGLIGVRPMASPVGFRGEFMYHGFGGKDNGADFRVLAGIINAELGLGGMGTKPYLIGGIGFYNGKADIDGVDAETDFGFNIGGGLEFQLAGFSTFAEARFHSIQTEGSSTNVIPISFGIKF